ncbi:MAG: cytochrome c biogenesis protein CcsA [Coriobacteriia bacterium]|nr:cytochrome c biogenesis protein CcsA [Coriobacteriia bacterium]
MTAQLLTIDPVLHILALVAYGAAVTFIVLDTLYARPAWGRRAGDIALLGGLALHTAGLAARWVATGHGPYITRYEVLSANAWVALVLWLLAVRFYPKARGLGIVLVPTCLLITALGVYTGPEVSLLPPTFSGIWLVMHVYFYFIAFAAALAAVSTSVLYILGRHSSAAWLSRLPDSATLDLMAYRVGGLAFVFWGIGMLTGSIWAYYAWGRFWGWDPVETWSLVTWFAFGLYLHLRRFFGWRGERAAWLLAGCFFLAAGTLFFTSLIDGSLHAVYFR